MPGFTADSTLKSWPKQVGDVIPADEAVDTDEIAHSPMVRGINWLLLTLIDVAVNALKPDEVVGL